MRAFHLSPLRFDSFRQKKADGWKSVDTGFHFGTKATAMIVADKLHRQGRVEPGDRVYLYEVELDVDSLVALSENRLGAWPAHSIVQRLFEDEESHPSITEEEIDAYFEDEILLEDGENLADWYGRPEEHDMLRRWLEEHGLDAVTYDNTFEGGGESVIVFDPARIEILGVEELELAGFGPEQ